MYKKIVFSILVFSFILSGCGKYLSMDKISPDEVMRKLQKDGDNSFFLVLTTSNCYSCDEYSKVIKQLQSEIELPLYYIDVNKTNEDKLEELKITLGEVDTLPMTYYFEKGNLKKENIKRNYIDLEEYKEWLKTLKQ